METDDAAAKLRMTIDDAVEEVRLRSLRRRSWPIKQVMEDMRSGQWELRRKAYAYRRLKANAGLAEVDPWNLPPEFAMPKETGGHILGTGKKKKMSSSRSAPREDEKSRPRPPGRRPTKGLGGPWPGVLRSQRHQDGLGHPRVPASRRQNVSPGNRDIVASAC